MNPHKIGMMFENQAEGFLVQEGYEHIERAISRRSAYDLTAFNEGRKYFIEVRGRRKSATTHFFTVSRNKLNRLRPLENVLFMFINQDEGYQIIPMDELEDHMIPIKINGNKVYIVNGNSVLRARDGFRRIILALENHVFCQLKDLKGGRTWNGFLVEAGLNYVKAEEGVKE